VSCTLRFFDLSKSAANSSQPNVSKLGTPVKEFCVNLRKFFIRPCQLTSRHLLFVVVVTASAHTTPDRSVRLCLIIEHCRLSTRNRPNFEDDKSVRYAAPFAWPQTVQWPRENLETELSRRHATEFLPPSRAPATMRPKLLHNRRPANYPPNVPRQFPYELRTINLAFIFTDMRSFALSTKSERGGLSWLLDEISLLLLPFSVSLRLLL
jgi:hypothetical protein